MKNFLSAIVMVVALCFAAENSRAQQSQLTIGDGGTTVKRIQVGRAQLANGVATISNTAITVHTDIFAERQIASGTVGVGAPIITRSNGASFTLTSKASDGTTTATGDQSTIAYLIIEVSRPPATPTPSASPSPTP